MIFFIKHYRISFANIKKIKSYLGFKNKIKNSYYIIRHLYNEWLVYLVQIYLVIFFTFLNAQQNNVVLLNKSFTNILCMILLNYQKRIVPKLFLFRHQQDFILQIKKNGMKM